MPAARPLITMFTDAGHCPGTNLASYAVWAKADGQTLRRSGIFRDPVDGTDMAEMRALVNGVFLVLAVMQPVRGTHIIAQTDSLSAIGALSGAGYKRTERQRARVRAIVGMMQERINLAGITVEYRHVKGHKGNATPRNAVNTWCDRECRRWLKEARQRHQAQPAAAEVA